MAVETVKIAEQINFEVVARGEVGVTAFAGKDMVLFAIPVHSGLAQPGAGGNDSLISNWCAARSVQKNEILGRKLRNALGVGLKVVDERDVVKFNFRDQTLGFNDPGKIGSFNASIAYRASHAEAGLIGPQRGRRQKFGYDLIQPAIFAAGKHGERNRIEMAVADIEEGQPCVCASDVACQNHFSKFLQWRPSRSSSSSASLGPQLPAA